MIYSHLHQLLDVMGEPDETITAMENPALLKYVITDPVMEIMLRSDVQRTIIAMIEADIVRLPAPEVLIEMSVQAGTHRFVHLIESAGAFKARTAVLHSSARGELVLISERLMTIDVGLAEIKVGNAQDQGDAAAVAMATAIALMLLHTDGLEKRLVETKALNKQRDKLKKRPIAEHIVVRIGTVYDSAGNVAAKPTGQGSWHSNHLFYRPAHTRRQHYGEGNQLTKVIFVAGVLCNYRPDSELVMPKRVIKV